MLSKLASFSKTWSLFQNVLELNLLVLKKYFFDRQAESD